ncbi:cholesterol oxidase substrate-binding domain-containing protein [Acinetobacter lactucae]|uniref:cholesterol oxidase substrate-binding domain-containing protein n=2 Tax=Acinetobacter lactucae TaxID=1785128 RepID=UPI001580F192|nr:cholesterol oxidase substrate-binding domain-containing protein [Acinetobacter lactucae]NUF37835.1 FAD-binding protein [Acinetobacter lactucae]
MSENLTNIDHGKRDFLKKMAGLAAAGAVVNWFPTTKSNAFFFSTSERLPDFPNVELYKQHYENWSGESIVEDVWTCSPKTQVEVLLVINWAYNNNYKIRAKGMSHNWSPIMIDPQGDNSRVLLVDMASHIKRVHISSGGIVTAEAGALMQDVLQVMESQGLGFVATPAPGDLTIGGVLAIDGHGTGIPALNEERQLGQTYGSISNLVTSITAVVFDPQKKRYIPKVFYRDHEDISALLVHLGRAFILSVQLQSSKNQNLRCESLTNIHYKELFAAYPTAGKTFSSFLDKSGRVEAIWFPFTDYPWVKVWTVTESRPVSSRITRDPFNYWFSDNVPKPVTDLIHDIVIAGQGYLTPTFGQLQFRISQLGLQGSPLSGTSTWLTGGLLTSQTYDLWGASKNLLLYVKPTTLRVTANGYAVLTSRQNVQKVIHDFCENYQQRVDAYRSLNRYPMNGPVEIRVTGLDHATDSIVPNAKTAALSAIKPCPDHPEWDCAVWFDILTLPGTQYAAEFYTETEQWMHQHYRGDSLIRPEWSKGWGYTQEKAWANDWYLNQEIPYVHAVNQPQNLTLAEVKNVLNRLDPARLFSSPLVDRLL